MKKKKLILIVLLIILLITLFTVILFGINKQKEQQKQIEEAALQWYYEQDELYGETTVELLHTNGYIKNTKNIILKNDMKCQVVKIENNKATLTKNKNCELNKNVKQVPIIMLSYIDENDKELTEKSPSSTPIKVKVSYKNKTFDKKQIDTIYISKGEETLSIDDQIKESGKYELRISMKDGNLYRKEFIVNIDTTVPTLITKNLTKDNFDVVYEDQDTGISRILYYISDKEVAPTSIEQFVKKEELDYALDKTYYVWSVGINNVGLNSNFDYLGSITKKQN